MAVEGVRTETQETPTRIGTYRIDSVLARGAYGVVYRATTDAGAAIAVKTLHLVEERELESLRMGERERVTDTHLPHIRALPEVLPDLFAAAARRAEQAGFDGVELHYAHAYTMASFLSALNARDDGGRRHRAVDRPVDEVLQVARRGLVQDPLPHRRRRVLVPQGLNVDAVAGSPVRHRPTLDTRSGYGIAVWARPDGGIFVRLDRNGRETMGDGA